MKWYLQSYSTDERGQINRDGGKNVERVGQHNDGHDSPLIDEETQTALCFEFFSSVTEESQ